MSKTVLGAGIIGCGTFCNAYLATLGPVYKNTKVVACSDIDVEKAYETAKKWNIPHPCTTEELLADPEVDYVIIVTGPGSHYPLTMQALKAGKHVYCEKPMCITLEQANEIVEYAEAHNLYVTNAPDTFLDASMQTVRKVIDNGKIGKPLNITMNFVGPGHEMWHPNPEFYYKKGGGPVLDMAPYYLTAAVSVLGPIDEIYCYSNRAFSQRWIYDHNTDVEVDTDYVAILKFKNGVIGNINVSFDGVRYHLPGMEITGTEGTVYCPDPNTLEGDIKVLNRAKLVDKVRDDKMGPRWMYSDEAFTLAEDIETLKSPIPTGHNHRGMGAADMADCIINGKKPRCSMQMARHVTEAILAFDKCVKSGMPYRMTTTCDLPDPMEF
ncbi:MAG: Gfo/Idh/MocA family oxidoreductase [Oscillospiraceae bacterium]|nr:Gfo/Idh/MocA family oxidoreductase [Oscillospiraceae bacterium]